MIGYAVLFALISYVKRLKIKLSPFQVLSQYKNKQLKTNLTKMCSAVKSQHSFISCLKNN